MGFFPKVSVVIPVYNGSNYLREAIDSALAQTYKNIEVIVVNDGSSDNGATDEIARSFGVKIRYFSKENGGVSSALNFGIQEMTGEYFSWLSHDDLYFHDKISSQVDHLRHSVNKDIIHFGDREVIDANGKFISLVVIDEAYLNNPILLILSTYLHGCSLLIPKTAFDRVGWFNEDLKCVQDVELWLRLAMAGFQFTYAPKVMVKSRVHQQQTTWALRNYHAREKRDYNLWAVDFINQQTLLAYYKEIIKILFKKNQPSAIDLIISILHKNNKKNDLYLISIKVCLFMLKIRNYLIEKLWQIPGFINLRNMKRKYKIHNI